MFLQEETIKHADSPRLMSLRPWLFSKSLRTTNKYTKTVKKSSINIDVRAVEESIKHGYIYLNQYRDLTFAFVFKIGNGIYQQYGFHDGSIAIPLPDIYIEGTIDLYYSDGAYECRPDSITIGSPFLQQIPLSNIYYDSIIPSFAPRESDGLKINYSGICYGNSFRKLVGPVQTPHEAINKIASIITSFLLTHGNLDLRPLDYRYNDNQPTTTHIIQHLDVNANVYKEAYAQYWSLLNLLSRNYAPNELYQQLANCNEQQILRNLLSDNNITLEDITQNSKCINNNYVWKPGDDDDDDDDYDDEDYDDEW